MDPARSGTKWYSYAGGDPVNFADSDGQAPERVDSITIYGEFVGVRFEDILTLGNARTTRYSHRHSFEVAHRCSALPPPHRKFGAQSVRGE